MKSLIIVLSVYLISVQGVCQVRLPRLISSGMVLQRDVTIKIWGWASPNEGVTLRFNNHTFKTIADNKGNWSLGLPAQKAGGPYQMTIKASNEINLKDILIGDTWICSGQSNMELTMERVKYKYTTEMLHAGNPDIRQFTVPDKYDFINPQPDLEAGNWLPLTPGNISSFSAVAYFFAKALYEKYKVPIGLINAALGGSPAEAWISESALKKLPAYYQQAQKFKNKNLIKTIESNDSTVSISWYKQLNETDDGLINNWNSPLLDDAGWKEMNIPGYWADTETGLLNGAVWFRKEFDVPETLIGKPAKLELGRIADANAVFINGQWVGTTSYQYPPRRYGVSDTILKKGKNNITVRITSNSGRGGFVPDKPYQFSINNEVIGLKGTWKYKVGVIMKPLPAQTFIRWKPLGLYNAMIAPLIKFPIKGVIWYQGESNASRPDDYGQLMRTLIEDWRMKWNQGSFPFLYVQLPNFMEPAATPQESNWAALRQQQLNTLSVRNTAMAVAIDVGEWNDIHPENKQAVGQRLALLAVKNVYGEKSSVASGPLYQSMKKEGNRIIVTFSNTGSGLMTGTGNQLKYFAIAGANKKYLWANAIIKDNTVIVWNEEIQHPVSVRYAWADNPEGANLYNKEGLPASPFTTDK
ncbi:MAG: sialate O-acetylesterase [Ferruginibacter sp.]|nr:sialate O-acetylesterase [Ferruginibacter sp.]